MARVTGWCDTVGVLRAASKALVVPYAMLEGGLRGGLPPSASAFLAFSYLVPWIVVNWANSGHFMLGQRRVQRYARRPQGRDQGADDADADCGATPAEPGYALPNLTEAEAVQTVLI